MVTIELLTVEDTFFIPSLGGLIVVPGPLMDEYRGPESVQAELIRPDGTALSALVQLKAFFQTPPPRELRWGCIVKGVEKQEVPIGTRIVYEPTA